MSPVPRERIRLSELWPYAVTIFLGAFLLFQVQPMISKMILPWYGGSPSVWTTCMFFFQSLLVGGYAYVHVLMKIRALKVRIGIHVALLFVACLLLPVTPGDHWKPDGSGTPVTEILWLLLVCAGLPYFLLSATGPLVQVWFSRAFGNASPYRLFALSNAGSLLALVSYPFFFEPQFALDRQGIIWAVSFVVYAIACALVGWKANRRAPSETGDVDQPTEGINQKTKAVDAALSTPLSDRPGMRMTAWILLPALASIALLAITNHVCQDVAVIPFLWIAPLSLYLLSFIICFERESWYSRRWYSLLTLMFILLISNMMLATFMGGDYYELFDFFASRIDVQIFVFLTALFLLCMVCHGELAALKPEPSRLTGYYLAISIGGAIGGLFVAIVCPLIFNQFYELNLILIAGFVLALLLFLYAEWRGWLSSRLIRAVSMAAVLAGFVVLLWAQYENARGDAIKSSRNFYGTLHLRYPRERDDVLAIYSGGVVHGTQQTGEGLQSEPTLYYTRNSGVGRVLRTMNENSVDSNGLDVALVGLGAGTLAAYGTERDRYYLFEINPAVIEMAKSDFTFLRDCPAKTEIIPGDARLSLNRFKANSLDVLVLDAFSGDSVPTHLLTTEAFDLYLEKLRPDGVICVHTSNLHLQLSKVVTGQAHFHDLACRGVRVQVDFDASPELKFIENSSEWVLLHRHEHFFRAPLFDVAIRPWPEVKAEDLPVWTDKHCNVFEILMRN